MPTYTPDEIKESRLFSRPMPSIEAAQALHAGGLFEPAAVFQAGEGQFVMVRLRSQEWPPHQAAAEIERATGYTMVSTCDPLLNNWNRYERPAQQSAG